MSPEVVFLVLYPAGMILLAYIMKYVLRRKRKANVLIYFLVYVLSNIGIAFFIRGGFKVSYLVNSGKGLAAFAGFTLEEWIRTLIIPNVFTLLYIFLVAIALLVLQKLVVSKKFRFEEKLHL